MFAFIRICSRLPLHKRCLSTTAKGSSYGFECSKYAHRGYDLNLLEKLVTVTLSKKYECENLMSHYITVGRYETAAIL